MKMTTLLAAALLLPALHATAGTTQADLERGRYLVKFGGCNDCHTPGYPEADGNLPEKDWLIGSPVGFQGPWGTAYPANLRLTVARMNEEQWLVAARARRMPPMPWFALRDMPEEDLRAMYRYIRSLGPAGDPAPAYVAPGGVVTTPYFDFVPVEPSKVAKR